MLRRLCLVLALALAGSGCAYRVDIARPAALAETTKVFAADGSLITTLHAEQDREEVTLAQVSPVLVAAVLAIEDSRFFAHKGVDLRAVARALRRNAEAGEVREGGSTITQQYVKNVLLDPKQTVHRKMREAVMAIQLERTHTKEAILEGYLNRIYFGNGAYGVQAAAQLYFHKPASDVTLAEGALLAGLIQAPEGYDPYTNPDAALARRQVVLDRMRQLGSAPGSDITTAEAAPLGVGTRKPSDSRYPAGYFVERVKQFILNDERFGATPADRRRLLFEEGLRIRTTVDLRIQQEAEEAVKAVLPNPATDPSGAVVVLDPSNGFVRALVGGRDFFGSEPEAKFDLATQGMRQTGSSFKPIVLAEALAQGISPEKVYEAPATLTVPMPAGQAPWVVSNYEGEGGAPESLVDATVHSVNTVYAQLIQEVGPQKAIDMAHTLGIGGPLQPFPSAVLGSNEVSVLDMASAYSTFAADGMHADPVFVTEITRSHRGRPGRDRHPEPGRPAGDGGGRPTRGPAGGGQDRHSQRVERRLVRRVHAGTRDRRLGGVPGGAAVDDPAGHPDPGDGRFVAGADLEPGDGAGAGGHPGHPLPGARSRRPPGADRRLDAAEHGGAARRRRPVRDAGPPGPRGGGLQGRVRTAAEPAAGVGHGGRPDAGAGNARDAGSDGRHRRVLRPAQADRDREHHRAGGRPGGPDAAGIRAQRQHRGRGTARRRPGGTGAGVAAGARQRCGDRRGPDRHDLGPELAPLPRSSRI
jgi:hypothetical protein